MTSLGACDSGSGSGSDSGDGGGATTDEFVRATLVLGDGTELAYDAFSMLADGGCSGLANLDDSNAVEATHEVAVRWDVGVTPSLGMHATGDEQGVDLLLIGGGVGGNVGPADPGLGNPGGTVTFSEFGDVVAGTFEAETMFMGDAQIHRAVHGSFRCVRK